ncbi:13804_t:CDS:2, partial [Dentiscutata heterogama]
EPDPITGKKLLSLMVHQRSADIGLGLPFNITSISLFLYMVAHLTDTTPDFVNLILGDAYIYKNHIDSLKEQIKRTPFEFPTIKLKRQVNDVGDFKFSDFILENYNHHKSINFEIIGAK